MPEDAVEKEKGSPAPLPKRKRGDFVHRVRSWAYQHHRPLWSLYHELKKRVQEGRVNTPDTMPVMDRRATVGNLLVAALLEILRLREEVQFKDDRITSVMIERDEARKTLNDGRDEAAK